MKPPSIPDITQATNTLHLLYHRNKNQHRHSAWWKHLSILKRSLQKLIRDLSSNPSNTLDADVQAKVAHLKDTIAPRCYVYRAFSQVVADPQFAALGLVLLATLARANALLVLPKEKTKAREGQGTTVVAAVAEPALVPEGTLEDLGSYVARVGSFDDVNSADLGGGGSRAFPANAMDVKPAGEPSDAEAVVASCEATALRASSVATPIKKEKKKKRKRAKDEIDDLFADLI